MSHIMQYAWGCSSNGHKALHRHISDAIIDELQIDMGSKPDGVHKKMEKYILRKAFDVAEDPYLPAEVLWRQKEQFSDGVGYDWVDGLRDYAHQVRQAYIGRSLSLLREAH